MHYENYQDLTTFEGFKTAKELGIDTTRRFVLVNSNKVGARDGVTKGDVLTLIKDDDSDCPYFTCPDKPEENHEGGGFCCCWYDLAYLPEPAEDSAKTNLSPALLKALRTELEALDRRIAKNEKTAAKLEADKKWRDELKKLMS